MRLLQSISEYQALRRHLESRLESSAAVAFLRKHADGAGNPAAAKSGVCETQR